MLLLICLSSGSALAETEGAQQARSFTNLYTSLCVKHLMNLDELREKLASAPKLPLDKARFFLTDRPGDAWPIPDKYGLFVLALPAGANFCAVYARRADTEAAQKRFIDAVKRAPSPLIAREVENTRQTTQANGETHTVSYEWSTTNASRNLLFTLTTAPSPSAHLQVMGSAAIVRP